MKARGTTWVSRGRGWAVMGALCLLACGGKADEGEDGDPNDADAGVPIDPATKPSPGSTQGDTALGECRLGFMLVDEPSRDCAWLARDRCYATKAAACDCICPTNRQHSVCSSGFPDGPNGKVEVKCY